MTTAIISHSWPPHFYSTQTKEANKITWSVSSRGVTMGVRAMVSMDLPAVSRMVDGENWLKSAQSVLNVKKLGPRGALVALNSEQEVIAFITSVDIGQHDTAVLYIIVDRQYRKMGIGRELIEGLANFQGRRVISLLAYPGAETFYNDIGFRTIPDMTVMVYFIRPDFEALARRVAGLSPDIHVDTLGKVPLRAMAAYDEDVCGYSRKEYLEKVLVPETSVMLAAYTGRDKTDLTGYCGAAMVNKDTLCIAPLYANSEDVADTLFTRIVSYCRGEYNISQVKIITPMVKPFLTRFGIITKSIPLLMMSNGDINFELSERVYSCINTSFP